MKNIYSLTMRKKVSIIVICESRCLCCNQWL